MAKATDWGLTDAGFRRPTYAELLMLWSIKHGSCSAPKPT